LPTEVTDVRIQRPAAGLVQAPREARIRHARIDLDDLSEKPRVFDMGRSQHTRESGEQPAICLGRDHELKKDVASHLLFEKPSDDVDQPD
jgi:hypothetical protein